MVIGKIKIMGERDHIHHSHIKRHKIQRCSRERDEKTPEQLRSVINTIAKGFLEGGATTSTGKGHLHQV